MGEYYPKEYLGSVSKIIMGQSPPGSTYNKKGKGLPFFQGVKDFNYRHPSVRVYCSAPSRIAQPGDILFSVRAPIGRVNIADRECCIGRGLSIIRAKSEIDQRYIEFVLRLSETSWQSIESGGTVFGNATKKDLHQFSINWPSHFERQRIAHILGSLDDKIELNHQINQTLESIAQTIFKSWFVDFDPVKAKMEGREPEGMDTKTAALFPDKLVKSELGMIPEGWDLSSANEVLSLKYGKALKKNDRIEGQYPVYGSGGIAGSHNKFLVTGPGIIVGRKGSVGTVYWSDQSFYPIDTVFYVDSENGYPMSYLYFLLIELNLPRLSADSAVPGINRNTIHAERIVKPDGRIVNSFRELVNSMFETIANNLRQNETLLHLRNTLLPKLISGEIQIPTE